MRLSTSVNVGLITLALLVVPFALFVSTGWYGVLPIVPIVLLLPLRRARSPNRHSLPSAQDSADPEQHRNPDKEELE